MKEVLLIKLGEMVLKGQNRRVFDQALLKNIKQALRGTGALDVRYAQSTVYVIPEDAESDMDLAEERIGKVFGVISYVRACTAEKTVEGIQKAANPDITTTIKDRYFNSASATPALVFPTLINLAQKHLRKLKNQRTYWDKQITELLGLIRETYPARMTLPEQGAFQLGYYHQVQTRFTKKEEEKENG